MTLNTEEILNNSFVVTIDGERVAVFYKWFEEQGLRLPEKFIGYELTRDYLLKQFQFLRQLQKFNAPKVVERNVRLFRAISNNVSHWSIVQLAKHANLPFVTIFEDDAKPVGNLRKRMDELCSDIPDETDVLRLGYTKHIKRLTDYRRVNLSVPHSDNLIIENLSGSHAYIVFQRYYDRFITENKIQPRCDFIKINPTLDKTVFALKESLFNQVNLPDRPVISSWKLQDGSIKVNH